ncbi:MAG: hypothetical protein WAV11_02660 [Minisyncoccia bacterium]
MDNINEKNICQHGKYLGIGCRLCEKSGWKPGDTIMVPTKKAIISLLEVLEAEKKAEMAKEHSSKEKLSIIEKDIENTVAMLSHY